jgi:hypothetical protein
MSMAVEITKAGKKGKDRHVVNDEDFQEVVEMMIRQPTFWSLVYGLAQQWDGNSREANRTKKWTCSRLDSKRNSWSILGVEYLRRMEELRGRKAA